VPYGAKYEKGDFGERRLQIHHELSTAHQKWLRSRFDMGGTYLNFELEIQKVLFFKYLKNTTRISVKN
jgi:hypothetical protein